MTDCDNASRMEVGQFAELVTAVVRNIPRDMSTQQAQRWIGDTHALSLVLRQALDGSHQTFILEVNYDQSVEEALKAGSYDWTNTSLTSEHFPPTRRGVEQVEVHLVHFGRRYMTSGEVSKELEKQGLRPATIEELFALGAIHPDLQRQFSIIALGSVWLHLDGDRLVPGLRSDDRGRSAQLLWSGSRWGSACRFAAVSK